MSGLIGKKVGMTNIYDNIGQNLAVTVVEVEPCVVTQLKTVDNDGYNAIQLAAFDKKEKNVSSALKGHFDKAGTTPKKYIVEFRGENELELAIGDVVTLDDVFSVGDTVEVVGKSKGRGFTGVMKRHNFGGVGDATHGQGDQERAGGSVGNASDPSRVFKGKKMPGRSGNTRVKAKGLTVAKILAESNLILITGSIPGPKGRMVELHKKA